MKATRIFDGDMFIIPNPPMMKSELDFGGIDGRWKAFQEKMTDEWKNFGIDTSNEEKFIEIWVGSPRCDNWADHFIKFRQMTGIEDPRHHKVSGIDFPKYFPASLLKDAKESNSPSIILYRDGQEFHLTTKQKGYRYENHGNFEDVYKTLMEYVTPEID